MYIIGIIYIYRERERKRYTYIYANDSLVLSLSIYLSIYLCIYPEQPQVLAVQPPPFPLLGSLDTAAATAIQEGAGEYWGQPLSACGLASCPSDPPCSHDIKNKSKQSFCKHTFTYYCPKIYILDVLNKEHWFELSLVV